VSVLAGSPTGRCPIHHGTLFAYPRLARSSTCVDSKSRSRRGSSASRRNGAPVENRHGRVELSRAASPGDFVDEWVTSDWKDGSQWSDSLANKLTLARVHASAKSLYGEFDGPDKRCRFDPTLWQVTFLSDPDGKGQVGPGRHFLVRWLAPYRFSLVAVRRTALPGCDQTDAMPDRVGTFFASPGSVPLGPYPY
jgi:hypothetical protein